MCIACSSSLPNRRKFLALSAASVAAALRSARAPHLRPTPPPVSRPTKRSRDSNPATRNTSALRKFAPPIFSSTAKQVAKGQTPWAAILTCADSRVPPELLFGGLGLGELFVARNAGNMADTATMGTIEYGVEHLGVPLVVVIGHRAMRRRRRRLRGCREARKVSRLDRPDGRCYRSGGKGDLSASRATLSTTPFAKARNEHGENREQKPIVWHLIKAKKSKSWRRVTILMTAASSF